MSIIDALKTQLPFQQKATSGLGALVQEFATNVSNDPRLTAAFNDAIRLQSASSGGVKTGNDTYVDKNGNPISYDQGGKVNNMTTLPGVPEGDTAESAAARQASRMVDSLSLFNKYAPEAKITKMSNDFLGNGNANYQSGFGTLNLGGHDIAIPNAVLQQVELTQRNNPTTWDPKEYWFNSGGFSGAANFDAQLQKTNPGAKMYTSYDASIGRVNQLNQQYQAQNPQGSINQFTAAKENQRNIEDQMQQLQKQAAQGLSETRDIAGNVTGGNVSAWEKQRADLQRQQAQAAQTMTNLDSRGARTSAEETSTRIAGQAYRDYERIFSPTVSNLPIVEIFQPQK